MSRRFSVFNAYCFVSRSWQSSGPADQWCFHWCLGHDDATSRWKETKVSYLWGVNRVGAVEMDICVGLCTKSVQYVYSVYILLGNLLISFDAELHKKAGSTLVIFTYRLGGIKPLCLVLIFTKTQKVKWQNGFFPPRRHPCNEQLPGNTHTHTHTQNLAQTPGNKYTTSELHI